MNNREEVIMNYVESLLMAGLIIALIICIAGAGYILWDIWNEAKKDREEL